jgi:hypothetical protein
MTKAAKRKILATIQKRGASSDYLPGILRDLERMKADPKIGKRAEEIASFLRNEMPRQGKVYSSKPVQDRVPNGNRFWNKSQEVGGTKTYQRDDLIDPDLMHEGLSNLQRMAKGRPPVSPNGKEIELHHMLQRDGKAMAEVTKDLHKKYFDALHINPNSQSSGIDRSAYNSWRKAYWKMRGKQF